MQNFKFEEYPTPNCINSIMSFDDKIDNIDRCFKKNQNCIMVNNLLSKEDNKTVIERLREIGYNPKTLSVFQGVYILYDVEKEKIEYVGISRKLITRLRQHANYSETNSASLAYLMAKKQKADQLGWNKRDDWQENSEYWKEIKNDFKENRKQFQKTIKNYMVTFATFDNSFEMALFEIYASIKWQTYWNSYRTH